MTRSARSLALAAGCTMMVAASAAHAQPFQHLYGNPSGPDFNFTNFRHVEQTADGGYLLTGQIDTLTTQFDQDALVVRMTPAGNVIWAKRFRTGDRERGHVVRETPDGGAIVIGRIESELNDYRTFMLKLDSAGNLQWSRRYRAGELPFQDEGESSVLVSQTPPGYVFVTRFDDAQNGRLPVWVRTDPNGAVIAGGYYITTSTTPDRAASFNDISFLPDGTMLVVGRAEQPLPPEVFEPGTAGAPALQASSNALATRLNAAGSPVWTKSYGFGTVQQGTSQYNIEERANGVDVANFVTETGGSELRGYIAGPAEMPSIPFAFSGSSMAFGIEAFTGNPRWFSYFERFQASEVGVRALRDGRMAIAGGLLGNDSVSPAMALVKTPGQNPVVHEYSAGSGLMQGVTLDAFSAPDTWTLAGNVFGYGFMVHTDQNAATPCNYSTLDPFFENPQTPVRPLQLESLQFPAARAWEVTFGDVALPLESLCTEPPACVSQCSPADIANTDGEVCSTFPCGTPSGGPDNAIDNGDFSAFFTAFFSDPSDPCHLVADIANTDGDTVLTGGGPDGVVDNGDFTAFFTYFFQGCL